MERTNESVTPTDRLVCMRVECLSIRYGCLHGRLDVWLIGCLNGRRGCLNGRRYVWIVFLLFRLPLDRSRIELKQINRKAQSPPFPLTLHMRHNTTHHTKHSTPHTREQYTTHITSHSSRRVHVFCPQSRPQPPTMDLDTSV